MVSVQNAIADSTDLESLPIFLAEGLSEEALPVLTDAIDWVREHYVDQTTSWGESLWEHTLGITMMAVSLRLDLETRLAALLFATCEVTDTGASKSGKSRSKEPTMLEQIEARFGTKVSQLVSGILGLRTLHSRGRAINIDMFAQAEVLRKMVLALVDDIRVILLWLCSHTQTLRYYSQHKDRVEVEVARECMELYAPLANRLGIWQLKWELEDLSFRFLEPDTYRRIAKQLDERRVEREAFIQEAIALLTSEVAKLGFPAQVYGRPKHIYSIYNKMRLKNLDFSQVYDVRALRVMVDTEEQCYAVMGLVHQIWEPIPNEFDDYILTPKGNNYQSLHTAVRTTDGRALEVQVRTFEMHRHAELGVAAHWRYKEGAKQSSGSYDEKIALLRELLSWRDEVAGSDKWEEQKRRAAFNDTIYVMTPQGRVVDLCAGATPVDFAYRLHTDLGHRCRGAKVNGQMVQLNTPLQNGQIVEILPAKQEGGPSRDWLNPQLGFIVSPHARTKVRRWFAQQEEEETISQGRAIVTRELQRAGQTQANLDELATRLGFKQTAAFFLAVGRGDVGARQVHNALYTPEPTPEKDHEERDVALGRSRSNEQAGGILVVGVGKLMTQLARCCKPVPPDPIQGFVTRGRGVSIHRHDCASLSNLIKQHPERVIEVQWGQTETGTDGKPLATQGKQEVYPVDIAVEATDRQGLLRDISDVFSHDKINVVGVNTVSKTGRAYMRFTVELSNLEVVQKILQHVGAVKGVEVAKRI